jgi:hypothetical protein
MLSRSNFAVSRHRCIQLLQSGIVLAVLGACQRHDGLPVGVNFVPSGMSSVAMNRNASTWRILINGRDVTEASKLRVVADATDAIYDIEFADETQVRPLPKNFRLQLGLDGVIRCQATPECPAGINTWKRVEVR